MKTVTSENIGEILQHIYDSEIDLHTGYLWDGGWDYSFENTPYPLTEYKPEYIVSTGETNFVKVVEMIVGDILEKFPKSGFSKWWNE